MAEVVAFDASLHAGRASAERCGQGGSDSCTTLPEFSVRGARQTISACAKHLAGAVREAEGMASAR
jgi:hypothetical protein